MKLCRRHNGAIRDALKKRDLWKLAQPERAKELAKRWLTGDMRNEADFDPYVVVWVEIANQAAELLRIPRDSPLCALCEVEREHDAKVAQAWVDRYSDLVYALAVKMGRAKAPKSGRSFISGAHLH